MPALAVRQHSPDLPPRRGGAAADGDFVMTARDFERVRALIYQRAGISLHDGKQAMVYSRLSRRLRETGHRSFADYLRRLDGRAARPASEWQEFVNCLTTNLTSFFREDHHFHAACRRPEARAPARPLRIWCNAASTGEEPYSIAMTVLEALGAARRRRDRRQRHRHQGARHRARAASTRPTRAACRPERLRQHFLRGKGANAGLMRVKPELAAADRVPHAQPDGRALVAGRAVRRRVLPQRDDLFRRTRRSASVLERIHRVMKPGGLLFVGHSENFTDSRDLFRLRGKTDLRAGLTAPCRSPRR